MHTDTFGTWRKSSRSANANNCLEAAWRKSTHSANANNCVEIGGWRKASYSNNNTACVEVGHGVDTVGIRDTKHRAGGTLTVSTAEWAGFLAALRS
ncbi:DUF397 domain-containing protein [Phytomonospora sp. NPDC050363]|uniref:DUF397 domain-containing protein n=1 Tax=Phytomonospora sp. NPDC050363 TaxID=3155642 RepID=UPI0033D58E99